MNIKNNKKFSCLFSTVAPNNFYSFVIVGLNDNDNSERRPNKYKQEMLKQLINNIDKDDYFLEFNDDIVFNINNFKTVLKNKNLKNIFISCKEIYPTLLIQTKNNFNIQFYCYDDFLNEIVNILYEYKFISSEDYLRYQLENIINTHIYNI